MKTDLILLASGYSRRFQGNKLLYELDGMPLIAHTLQKLSTLNPHSLIVVTQYEEVEKLARDYNAVVVFNTQARKGQSFSIRLGIERSTADQAMLCVADHIICVTCQGILRNPAIFPRKYYKELLALADEQGGKQILKKYREKVIAVPCDVDEVRDIDKRSDLK